jgi:hypothetical protein
MNLRKEEIWKSSKAACVYTREGSQATTFFFSNVSVAFILTTGKLGSQQRKHVFTVERSMLRGNDLIKTWVCVAGWISQKKQISPGGIYAVG